MTLWRTVCVEILESGECVVPHKLPQHKADLSTHVNWNDYISDSILSDVDTAVPLSMIREVAKVFEYLPEGFQLQSRVAENYG